MTSPSETIAKAIEGVTPGVWQVHQTVIHGKAYGGHWVEVTDEDQLIQISGSGGARSYTQRVFETQGHDDNEANARYVAACNPVAMREVLDELIALRETALQLEAMKREMAELRALLSRAEEYIIDGVTNAKADAEMNAAYPSRAIRYNAALEEVRQLHADVSRALIQGDKQ